MLQPLVSFLVASSLSSGVFMRIGDVVVASSRADLFSGTKNFVQFLRRKFLVVSRWGFPCLSMVAAR
jgi:hypothetical protein